MKAKFRVGDTIAHKANPYRRLVIEEISNGYYRFGYDENGYPMVAPIYSQDQFKLVYRNMSIRGLLRRLFNKKEI